MCGEFGGGKEESYRTNQLRRGVLDGVPGRQAQSATFDSRTGEDKRHRARVLTRKRPLE